MPPPSLSRSVCHDWNDSGYSGGELSGIELTWIYFGYSTLMSSFVLGGQATAAVLLGYANRTSGALILLPIISNIVVINFAFNIGTDTKIFSIILLLMDLFLLAGDWSLWKRIFWEEIPSEPAQPAILGNPTIKKFKVFLVPLCAVMIYALICYAQSNNAPHSSDGGLEVDLGHREWKGFQGCVVGIGLVEDQL